MTHTSLYSEFLSFNENRSRKSFFSKNIYQVVVNGEDGEYAEFEIEAKNENEAKAIAFCVVMLGLTNVNVNNYFV